MSFSPVAERGYTKPDLLAETDWLADHLSDRNLRVIDARSPELYAAGHIPGAVNLAAHGQIPRSESGDMGAPDNFESLAGSMGVSADSTVVIYDAPSAMMGMVAWAFLYYGHSTVYMLDGGFEKWTKEARPTSTETSSYPPARFDANLMEEIYCSLDQARSAQDSGRVVFWDVRTPGEYDGSEARNNPRPGHIAGAVHLEWTELLDPESRTFKAADELRALLNGRGITPESEINCY